MKSGQKKVTFDKSSGKKSLNSEKRSTSFSRVAIENPVKSSAKKNSSEKKLT